MPYLGDYLGHLLAEITMARVQADLEAVRIAELYASHPLLRHMPVPHFRLPMVTIDAPVVIKEMEVAKPGDPPRGGVVLPAMRERFDRLLSLHLKRAGLELSDKEKTTLKSALDQTITDLAQPRDVPVSLTHVAEELAHTVVKPLREPGREGGAVESERLSKFMEELKTAARVEFLNLRQAPPRLHVLVTTAELREAGPRELLVQLHLSISEEAFEWTMIETNGRTLDRLVPE